MIIPDCMIKFTDALVLDAMQLPDHTVYRRIEFDGCGSIYANIKCTHPDIHNDRMVYRIEYDIIMLASARLAKTLGLPQVIIDPGDITLDPYYVASIRYGNGWFGIKMPYRNVFDMMIDKRFLDGIQEML